MRLLLLFFISGEMQGVMVFQVALFYYGSLASTTPVAFIKKSSKFRNCIEVCMMREYKAIRRHIWRFLPLIRRLSKKQ